VGTPRYMAPEQARGEATTPATDVYGLGLVLAECLLGRPLVDDADMAVLLRRVAESPAPSIDSIGGGIPGELRRVLGKALAFDVADRYGDAQALADDLRRYLDGVPVQAVRPSLSRRVRSWTARHRGPLTTAGLTTLVLGALSGAAWGLTLARADRAATARELEAARQVTEAGGRIDALRASGDVARAEALFAEVVANPALLGTAALADAWMAEADRLDDADRRLEALGRAWMVTPDDHAGPTLLRLAGALRDDGRPEQVAIVGTWLRDLAPSEAETPEGRALLRDAAWWYRELDDPQVAAEPLAARWSHIRPVDPSIDALWSADLDGDGHAEVLAARDGSVIELDPATLTTRRSLWSGGRPAAVPGRPFTVVEGQVIDLRTGAAVARGWAPPSDEAPLLGVHDGQAVLVDPITGGTTPVMPLPDLGSELSPPASVQLGPSTRALAVGFGAWRAYDLRLYGPDGELMDHVRGANNPVALRVGDRDWLLLHLGQTWGNRRVFPAGDPRGMTSGLGLFEWDGDRLRRRQVWWTDATYQDCDLDGDGARDVLGTDHGAALVLRQAGGRFERVDLGGLTPLSVVDIDGDGVDEVFAILGDQRVLMGVGTERLPPIPRPRSAEEVDPELRRSLQVAALGLTSTAVRGLEAIAALEGDTDR
ncbi:MAG: hypothetical protein KC621_31235, partial [Myxococcales bacterium]|nr:hypothetical protein [Myxococcales bacterium]